MFTLAVPVVMAELGWMTMGLVDTLMVGRLGPEAIGAVGIGSSLFMGVCIFAMGLLLGLDTLVSHAFGAGRIDECHRWLAYGVALSLLLSIPVTILVLILSAALGRWGLHPTVLALTQPYLDVLAWSIPPLLLYASFRRYLQGMGVVRPVMIALVLANLLNAFVNWLLIFGHWGAPAMGVRGSAWGTVVARVVMAAVLLAVIVYRERSLVASRLPSRQRNRPNSHPRGISIEPMHRLLALGCRLAQGYYYYAPMPPDQITGLLRGSPTFTIAGHEVAGDEDRRLPRVLGVPDLRPDAAGYPDRDVRRAECRL